jgi:predicted aspartyl protease
MKHALLLILLVMSLPSFAAVTPWVEFTQSNGHIKIPVEIEGVKTYALLDTGANINAINYRFVDFNKLDLDNGKKFKIAGLYGTELKSSFKNVEVNLFGSDMELDDLVSMNLGSPSTGLLLGAGFFSQFIVQLDYPNSLMRLVTRDSLDMPKLANIKMQSQKGTGLPIVQVVLDGDKTVWLTLDTGNSAGLVMKRNVAESMGWLEKHHSEQGILAGVNKAAITDSFRISSVQFGPFELENVLVTVPSEGESSNLSSRSSVAGSRIKGKRVQGLLGFDVLKHFVITIDYKTGRAHVGLPAN